MKHKTQCKKILRHCNLKYNNYTQTSTQGTIQLHIVYKGSLSAAGWGVSAVPAAAVYPPPVAGASAAAAACTVAAEYSDWYPLPPALRPHDVELGTQE